MRTPKVLLALIALVATTAVPRAQAPPVQRAAPVLRGDGPFDRFVFRNIGPASPSGRVDDLWAAGDERGVFKTTDGGLNWQRVLFVDDDTGATELVMDPGNNKVQAKGSNIPPALKGQVESIGKELEGLRRRLGLAGGGGGFGVGAENVRGRIGQIKGGIMASTSLPTEVQIRQKKELESSWPKLASDATAVLAKLPGLAKDVVAAMFATRTTSQE